LSNAGRIQWVSGRPGEAPAYAGTDFIIARDGRIAAVYLFFDKLLPRRLSLFSSPHLQFSLPEFPASLGQVCPNFQITQFGFVHLWTSVLNQSVFGVFFANETLYQLSYTPIFNYENRVGTIAQNSLCTPILYTRSNS